MILKEGVTTTLTLNGVEVEVQCLYGNEKLKHSFVRIYTKEKIIYGWLDENMQLKSISRTLLCKNAEDGPEVDILKAHHAGLISEGLALFILQKIQQNRLQNNYVWHDAGPFNNLRETLGQYRA